MAYNSFPYSNFHELNLDYLLNKSKEIEGNVQETADNVLRATQQADRATQQANASANSAIASAQSAQASAQSASASAQSAQASAQSAEEARAAAGDPKTFTAAAQLTDTTKIYVYVGETGTYTYGHYYYYQAGSWHDGGVYGTWATDDALSDTSTNAVQNKVVTGAINSLKSDLNAYVSNLIIDFTWMSDKSFNTNTGAIKTQPGYNASYPIIGDDFFSQFNSNALNEIALDVICLWNDDSYVGYFFRLKYYNPSGTEITKPTYNRWAFSVANSRINTFHLRTVAYQDEVDNITNAVTLIAVETEQLINSFEWSAGYYSFTGGTPAGSISSYHRTNKLHGNQYEFDNPTIFYGSAYNYISFWLQSTYVGYYLNGKYYDPTQTEVVSIEYDEWAANIYTNNYAQLLPNSLGNRVNKLEIEFRPSPLQGKKLGCIGDSIAAGAGYAGGYGGIIASEYGMTIDNNATNGSVLVPQQSLSTIIPQLNNLDNDCDYVILEGGFNDSWLGSTIGEYSASYSEPTADDTFYGNLNYLLYTAVHKYAGKKMCFLIVHAGKQEYSCMNNTYPYYEATVKLCKKWGIPVVDLNQNCVPFGLLPVSDDIRTAYTANSGDGVHPNEDGYRKYYVPLIVAMLEAL